jgi:membrane-associated phospholipid phosphatase
VGHDLAARGEPVLGARVPLTRLRTTSRRYGRQFLADGQVTGGVAVRTLARAGAGKPYDPAMAERIGKQQQTAADALARRVEGGRGPGTAWAEALRELGAVDRATYLAVATTPTPELDGAFRRLSNAANHSRLWLGIAAALAVLGGQRGRRTALEGVLAIGATSATVNLGIKPQVGRPRPDRARPTAFGARQVRMPESTSFPSGHAASASAFAYTVGRHLPGLAVPIRLLAAGVAYSRVHTGVHYPGDVVIGSVLGSGTAAMVAALCDRIVPSPRPEGVAQERLP